MERRPIYVTLVVWFLVLLGAACFLSLAWSSTLLRNPDFAEVFPGHGLPPNERWLLSEFGFVLLMVTGKFMLEGANWARIVYVVWIVSWLGFCCYKDPDLALLLPNLLVHGTAIMSLFLPKTNRYFFAKYKWP
jgi:hypothetical protein